jgi:hypothetical protein
MTKYSFSLLIAASASVTLLMPQALAENVPEGETRLAQMLEGRVAGEPESCVRMMGHDRLIVIDGTAVVAKRGNILWVNRTADHSALHDGERMELRKASTTHLCERDQLTSFRRIESFPNNTLRHDEGAVELEEFVPYRLVR